MTRILASVVVVSALCIAAASFAKPTATILFAVCIGLLWLTLSSYQSTKIERPDEPATARCRSCGEELPDGPASCPVCGEPQ